MIHRFEPCFVFVPFVADPSASEPSVAAEPSAAVSEPSVAAVAASSGFVPVTVAPVAEAAAAVAAAAAAVAVAVAAAVVGHSGTAPSVAPSVARIDGGGGGVFEPTTDWL